jgi:tellurite resistance protein
MRIRFDQAEVRQIARALGAVAQVDGAILPAEQAFLSRFLRLFGLRAKPEEVTLAFDVEELAAKVIDPSKRREVITLCLAMALSDKDYAPEEQELIARIARAFGIPDADLVLLTIKARETRRY